MILEADTDQYPYKLRTDIVVRGHAYGYGRTSQIEAVILASKYRYHILTSGQRQCWLDHDGRLRFTSPALFERVPLDFRNAYGGHDRAADKKYGVSFEDEPELVKAFGDEIDLDACSPFRYPRNPVGKGYLCDATKAAVEALELPQLEDPLDPLTPERIVMGDMLRWHRMPIPRAPRWVDFAWYPRVAFFGIVPISEVFEAPPIEVERDLVPDYLGDGRGRLVSSARYEVQNGAPVGLQVPHLRGGEQVELHNLHPSQPRWRFTLPRAPKICTDGREGKLNSTEAVLQTLLLEPDKDRVTLIWRGCARALRPYLERERAEMPLFVEWR
ncbi:putative exported protein [Enhygromyxa salina]|uniref:Putative exported protein n=1 Tax=Enhygromyxa salina TaxID=215803 RepID=A0A0C2D924_9BACT|nr:putative exported protein [Enhygromyxa salina]